MTPTMPATGRPITFICPSSSLSSCCGPGAGRGGVSGRQRASVRHRSSARSPVALASRRLGRREASREGRVGALGRLGSPHRARQSPFPPAPAAAHSSAPLCRPAGGGLPRPTAVRGRAAVAAGEPGGARGWEKVPGRPHAPAGPAWRRRGGPAWPGRALRGQTEVRRTPQWSTGGTRPVVVEEALQSTGARKRAGDEADAGGGDPEGGRAAAGPDAPGHPSRQDTWRSGPRR